MAPHADPVAQVLAGGEICFLLGLVPHVSKLRVKTVQVRSYVLATPEDVALFQVSQATERPEQRRLARTVRTGELQNLAAVKLETHPAQDVSIPAPQMQPCRLQARIRHDPPTT